MQSEKNRFPVDSKVRFTQERLALLTPPDRKRLEDRIGVVQGYWHESRKPIVYFAEEGNRVELRLPRVDPRHLERVPEPVAPVPDVTAQITDTSDASDVNDPNHQMTQSELDALFG